MYSGPLLLNINPGPLHIDDYLNLEKWMRENTSIPEAERKPHLYTFIDYVYQTLIKENKDQVVNLLGQIGSGKSFNLVHILEYLCFFYGPDKKQLEYFDVINKSRQLLHILGSIFRQNNMESSSCGMLLKVGFDETNKICSFDLDAKILDLTLPFSENGRSFSILHSLITGASPEIKRILDLPERESSLTFFRKFSGHFSNNIKERFKLNDYEIWTRFHALLNFFEYSKSEVMEILQIFSFILLLSEAPIKKKRTKNGDEFQINKGPISHKLSKNFSISDDDFIKVFGTHKTLEDLKNTLISLMKHSYFIVFDGIKNRVNDYLRKFFEKKKPKTSFKNSNNSFNLNPENTIKHIYFLDIPGEVGDQTLGGMMNNLANECLNLFSGSQYMSVVEKLQNEQLNIKYFQPLHSFSVVESLLTKDGILNFLSNNYTEKNFKKLKAKINRKEHYEKCCKFIENLSNDSSMEFIFDFKFSHKKVCFNYHSLYLESKSLILNSKILKIFEESKNNIIKSQMNSLHQSPRNLYKLAINNLNQLFKPLEGLSPFVVYCLHSNSSLKLFFGKNENISHPDWEIPLNQTQEILKNSLTIPVLYWEWYGFHEWMDVELFISEFSEDFHKVQEKFLKIKNFNNKKYKATLTKFKDFPKDLLDLKKLNIFEAASYILSVVCSEKDYFLGSQHIIFRKDILKKAKEYLKNLINLNIDELDNRRGLNFKVSRNNVNTNYNKQNTSNNQISINSPAPTNKKNSTNQNLNKITENNSKKNTFGNRNKSFNSRNQSINGTFNKGNNSLNKNEENKEINPTEKFSRRKSMKIQCHLEIINYNSNYANDNKDILEAKNDLGLNLDIDSKKVNFKIEELENKININNIPTTKFNLFNFISHKHHNHANESLDSMHTTYLENEYENYKKEHNIIIPKNKYFNAFKNLFDHTKIENYNIFDYSEQVNDIKLIQTNWRSYKSRMKYKVFRYCCMYIVIVQKLIRGWIIRRKFKKFRYALKCINLIQKIYKRRHNKKSYYATKIQSICRMKMARIYFVNKLARKEIEEDSDDEINNKDKVQNLENINEMEENFISSSQTFNDSKNSKNNRRSSVVGKKDGNRRNTTKIGDYNDVIGNGFKDKYIKRRNTQNMEKELHDVSVSKIERKKSLEETSIINNKVYFNNMNILNEMEVEKDRRQILEILMGTNVIKGLGK